MNHRQASRATNAAAIIRAHTDIKLYSSDHSPLSLTIFLNTIFGARRHQVRFLVKSATYVLANREKYDANATHGVKNTTQAPRDRRHFDVASATS
jgi:hypothetical protein